AGVKDVLRINREECGGAAEDHGKEVQGHGAQQDLPVKDESDALLDGCDADRPPGAIHGPGVKGEKAEHGTGDEDAEDEIGEADTGDRDQTSSEGRAGDEPQLLDRRT